MHHKGILCADTAVQAVAILALAVLPALPAKAVGDKSPYDWALVRLDYAREEKVQQLRDFCERTHGLAKQAADDPIVRACFEINMKFSKARQDASTPSDLSSRVSELRDRFDAYYIANYLSFYDMLFVDRAGNVFYSLRELSRLDCEPTACSEKDERLGRCIETQPSDEVFIDFHLYEPSSEPAAFFVEPMRDESGVHIGWLVLQCAINRVNTLFAYTEDLGYTGETFLVNREGFMLTESNFEGASTILTRRLDDRNIQAKFTEGQGHRVVTDYRNCSALTSFEVVEFMGTKWLVVAKVDRHEVVTRHYSEHRKFYGDRLLKQLAASPVKPCAEYKAVGGEGMLRVDMDEFLKAEHGEKLHTFGVSTCTGFIAASPGKFAYLAHISPKDKVYGEHDTNLVGQVVKKVKTFDVYPCDRNRITFIIVSTHLDSLLATVDKLIEEKFLLSQVRVFYNPQAASAEVCYDYTKDEIVVAWRSASDSNERGTHCMADGTSLESVVQCIMDSEDDTAPLRACGATPAPTRNAGSESVDAAQAVRPVSGA